MVNLSLGVSYTHAGMKRQATNRSYLLLQGQMFMSYYMEVDERYGVDRFKMETFYNVGRLYHLLGISDLANEYYERALQHDRDDQSSRDIRTLIHANNINSALTVKNKPLALTIMKKNMRL